MADMIEIEAFVDADGRLVVQLPADAPRGRVKIHVEPVHDTADAAAGDAELEALLDEVLSSTNEGLPPEEVVKLPQIGIWADREDMVDSAAYVEKMRHEMVERRQRASWGTRD